MTPAIDRLFKLMCEEGASDLHLCVGMPPLVRKDGSKLTVRAVRDGSPAAGAGVRPGEVIASIDAVPATQDRWMAANGSRRPVKLVLVDGGQERSVTLSPAG